MSFSEDTVISQEQSPPQSSYEIGGGIRFKQWQPEMMQPPVSPVITPHVVSTMPNPQAQSRKLSKLAPRPKLDWSPVDDQLILRLLCEQVEEGNRPMGVFNKYAWTRVEQEVNRLSELRRKWDKDLTREQIKNRVDNLRRIWQAGEILCQVNGGLIDQTTGNFTGDHKWLDEFTKKHRGAVMFKTKPYAQRPQMMKAFNVADRPPTKGKGKKAIDPHDLGILTMENTVEKMPEKLSEEIPSTKRQGILNGATDVDSRMTEPAAPPMPAENAPGTKRQRKQDTTPRLANDTRVVAPSMQHGELPESQWIVKATELFRVKYARKLSFDSSKTIIKRFRQEKNFAQQFVTARDGMMRRLVMEIDLDTDSDSESDTAQQSAKRTRKRARDEVVMVSDDDYLRNGLAASFGDFQTG